MRHFLGYGSDGSIISIETYHGGWPECDDNPGCDCDPGCGCLADPNCRFLSCTTLRDMRAEQNPEIVGWIAYDCSCPPEAGVCRANCAGMTKAMYRVVDDQLLPKYGSTIYIDDEQVEDSVVISKTPGSQVVLRIVSPDTPDGTTFQFASKGSDVTEEPTFTATFSGGEITIDPLIVPSQGSRSDIMLTGGLVIGHRFILRGWAS